jgi:hypothetical protein
VQVEWWVEVGPTKVKLPLEVGLAIVSTWVACRKPHMLYCAGQSKKQRWCISQTEVANGIWLAEHCIVIVTSQSTGCAQSQGA